MSFTTITKSGKTIEMGDGVTRITSMKNGKKVTKVYHIPKMQAGTVTGMPANMNLKAGINNTSQPPEIRNQHPPNPAGRRMIKNQFNIQDSVIGQVAIGNRGPTYFNQSSHTYESGSNHTDFNISGGNFTQSNLGGTATYNNKNATVSAGGGGCQKSIDDLIRSDQVAENQIMRILAKQITIEEFTALLNKGYTLQKIDDALQKNNKVELMIKSMLQPDAMEDDDDDDDV